MPGTKSPYSFLLPCAQAHSPLQNFTQFQVLEECVSRARTNIGLCACACAHILGLKTCEVTPSIDHSNVGLERFGVSASIAEFVLAGSDKYRQTEVQMIADTAIVRYSVEGIFLIGDYRLKFK